MFLLIDFGNLIYLIDNINNEYKGQNIITTLFPSI
jgi:hypothetical protein